MIDVILLGDVLLQAPEWTSDSRFLTIGTTLVILGTLFLIQAQLMSVTIMSPRAAVVVTLSLGIVVWYYFQQGMVPDWYLPAVGTVIVVVTPLALCFNLFRELSVV